MKCRVRPFPRDPSTFLNDSQKSNNAICTEQDLAYPQGRGAYNWETDEEEKRKGTARRGPRGRGESAQNGDGRRSGSARAVHPGGRGGQSRRRLRGNFLGLREVHVPQPKRRRGLLTVRPREGRKRLLVLRREPGDRRAAGSSPGRHALRGHPVPPEARAERGASRGLRTGRVLRGRRGRRRCW